MERNKDRKILMSPIGLKICNKRFCIPIASQKLTTSITIGNLGVPGWLWNFLQQKESSELPVLVSNRVMQCMCPNISPETVQGYFRCGRLRTGQFEDTRGNTKASVSSRHFDTGDPFSRLTTRLSGDLGSALKISSPFVDRIDFSTGAVCQRCGGA